MWPDLGFVRHQIDPLTTNLVAGDLMSLTEMEIVWITGQTVKDVLTIRVPDHSVTFVNSPDHEFVDSRLDITMILAGFDSRIKSR